MIDPSLVMVFPVLALMPLPPRPEVVIVPLLLTMFPEDEETSMAFLKLIVVVIDPPALTVRVSPVDSVLPPLVVVTGVSITKSATRASNALKGRPAARTSGKSSGRSSPP